MFQIRAWVSLGLFVVGCGGGCGASDSGGEQSVPEEPASGEEQPEAPAEPEVPGPAPTTRVFGDVHERSVSPRIESLGPELAEVGGAIEVQRQDGELWVDEEVELHLRDSCETPPLECLTLAPGAVFMPPAWGGQRGASQCGCDDCEPAPAGTYRFVIHGCGLTEAVVGAPFELP